MAKIHEENIIVRLSAIVKDNDQPASAVTPEMISTIEQVAQELAGAGVIVEVVEVAK